MNAPRDPDPALACDVSAEAYRQAMRQVAAAVLVIWLALRKQARQPARLLLAEGAVEEQAERNQEPRQERGRLVRAFPSRGFTRTRRPRSEVAVHGESLPRLHR